MEALEGNTVKLYVEIEEPELAEAIDQAWSSIAREARIPGFRKGKVPRKVLEARVGAEYARAEALRAAVPEHLVMAMADNLVDPISEPQVDITEGEEAGPVEFEATVEIRPEVEVEGYGSISVTVQSPSPTDDEVADYIDRLRAQFGGLVDVERPIGDDDFVKLDISGEVDGEPFPGLTANDYLYQVGSGMVAPQFDEALMGASVGDTVETTFPQPGGGEEAPDVSVTAHVTQVQERELPDLTDEWVADATEFETVAELRDDVVENLSSGRLNEVRADVRSKIADELAELVSEEPDQRLVASAFQDQLRGLNEQAERFGLNLEQFLAMTQQDPTTLAERLRSDAVKSVKFDAALRAVAKAQGLEPTAEDMEAEIEHLAFHAELTPEQAGENLRRNGHYVEVRSDVARRKALDWLIETIDITDVDGNAVDRSVLAYPEHDHGEDHEHDHDHDAEGDDDVEEQ